MRRQNIYPGFMIEPFHPGSRFRHPRRRRLFRSLAVMLHTKDAAGLEIIRCL
jgi:hypothetical protein